MIEDVWFDHPEMAKEVCGLGPPYKHGKTRWGLLTGVVHGAGAEAGGWGLGAGGRGGCLATLQYIFNLPNHTN